MWVWVWVWAWAWAWTALHKPVQPFSRCKMVRHADTYPERRRGRRHTLSGDGGDGKAAKSSAETSNLVSEGTCAKTFEEHLLTYFVHPRLNCGSRMQERTKWQRREKGSKKLPKWQGTRTYTQGRENWGKFKAPIAWQSNFGSQGGISAYRALRETKEPKMSVE